MLQSNLYEMPLCFLLSSWLMLTTHFPSHCHSFHILKKLSGWSFIYIYIYSICPFSLGLFGDQTALYLCVTSVTSLWKCSSRAWMGADPGVELGHTKGITSPSWCGSTWVSPKWNYTEVAGGKFSSLPHWTWPRHWVSIGISIMRVT